MQCLGCNRDRRTAILDQPCRNICCRDLFIRKIILGLLIDGFWGIIIIFNNITGFIVAVIAGCTRNPAGTSRRFGFIRFRMTEHALCLTVGRCILMIHDLGGWKIQIQIACHFHTVIQICTEQNGFNLIFYQLLRFLFHGKLGRCRRSSYRGNVFSGKQEVAVRVNDRNIVGCFITECRRDKTRQCCRVFFG